MASRYLRANGNWNGPVWAATSGGAAGSAATPTASDAVYIAANFTVTLTANATCYYVSHTNGTISFSSFQLTVANSAGAATSFTSTGTTSRSINLDSGMLTVGSGSGDGGQLILSGSNLSFNAGTSLVKINRGVTSGYSSALGSYTFNDVQINIGHASNSVETAITGSPTFRSLIIQSKNSAAHTVNFDDASSITTDKLVLVGSSSANKLTLKTQTAEEYSDWWIKDSMYGQYVNAIDIYPDTEASAPLYLGSNSTATRSPGWLLQDPPKISTLVDSLTTAPGSNSNWTVSGTVTQIYTGAGDGGYALDGTDSIVSTGTFDLVDSEIVLEVMPTAPFSDGYFAMSVGWFTSPPTSTIDFYTGTFWAGFGTGFMFGEDMYAISDHYRNFAGGGGTPSPNILDDYVDSQTFAQPYTVRLSVSSSTNTLIAEVSSDGGGSWVLVGSGTITNDELSFLRASRISFAVFNSELSIGSVNILPTPQNTGAFLQFFVP